MLTLESRPESGGIRGKSAHLASVSGIGFIRTRVGVRAEPDRGRKAYNAIVSGMRRGGESRGQTEARIDFLVENASEWSLELGVPELSRAAAEHALKILSHIGQARRDAELRIFPSEQAGLSIQKRGATETRVLEVNPGAVTGAIHDKQHHVHHHYLLESDRAAAAFLMAA